MIGPLCFNNCLSESISFIYEHIKICNEYIIWINKKQILVSLKDRKFQNWKLFYNFPSKSLLIFYTQCRFLFLYCTSLKYSLLRNRATLYPQHSCTQNDVLSSSIFKISSALTILRHETLTSCAASWHYGSEQFKRCKCQNMLHHRVREQVDASSLTS